MLPPANFGIVQPFKYKVVATLSPSGTTIESLTLNSDSQFRFKCYRASSTLQDPNDVSPNTFQVLIKVNDQDLSNGREDQRVICGPANWGYEQEQPIIYAPKSQFVFDFLNLIAGETDNVVNFYLVGDKLML